jgi:hypothetical protein
MKLRKKTWMGTQNCIDFFNTIDPKREKCAWKTRAIEKEWAIDFFNTIELIREKYAWKSREIEKQLSNQLTQKMNKK